MKRSSGMLTALLVVGTVTSVMAQVDVLTPDLVAKLDPAKEKPLTLAPTGDAARFVSGEPAWREAGEPLLLDLDDDGVRDFVVFALVHTAGMQRALIIHDWGDVPAQFGEAVFYVIIDAGGNVLEWAGTYRLTPRRSPAPNAP